MFELNGGQLLLEGRRIGWVTRIDKKRVFRSPRNRAEHYFRIFQGWGLSKDVFDFLSLDEFDEIQLVIGKRELLISTLSDWKDHAIPYHKPPFEQQIVLPEKYMKRYVLPLSQIMP